MHVEKYSLTLTMSTSLTDTEYTPVCNGAIMAIGYTKSTSATISSTATLAITTETSARNILTSMAVGGSNFLKCPREVVVNTTNGAVSNESALIPIANERIKCVVAASSAASLTGTFDVIIDGSYVGSTQ